MKSECRNAISNQVDLQRTALRMHLMLQRTDSNTLQDSEDVKKSRVSQKMSPMVYFPGQISLFLKLLALRMQGPPFMRQI